MDFIIKGDSWFNQQDTNYFSGFNQQNIDTSCNPMFFYMSLY